MESEGSLSPLQVTATCPHRQPDQSSPCPPSYFLKIHLNITIPSKPGSSKWSLSLRFPHQNPVCISLLPHTCYKSRPSHSSWFDHRVIFGEQYRSLSSSLCSFLHSPVTSSFPGTNILSSTFLSNTLSLRSSLNVSDQVSHPYKTTGKIIILYILVFKFLDSSLEDKIFYAEW